MNSRTRSTAGPRPLPRFVSVGFVGKRQLNDLAQANVAAKIGEVLDGLSVEFPSPANVLMGISSVAQGADTLFAEELVRRRLLHRVYLPEPPDRFFDVRDFAGSDALTARSSNLLQGELVIEVRVSSRHGERRERFTETSYEIVNECGVLLAVATAEDFALAEASPEPSTRPGGTAETLRYARQLGRRAFVIVCLPDGGLTIHEWPAAREASAHEPTGFFGPPETAMPLGELDFLAELVAIKDHASKASAGRKALFHYLGRWVLLAHVLATLVAALAFALETHDHSWSYFKSTLLAAGLGLALWLHFRRQQTQTAWVQARQVAEICRSTLALTRPVPFPGSLRHLRDFQMPRLQEFTASINILHLRNVRRSQLTAMTANKSYENQRFEFVARYTTERIEDQLMHFNGKAKVAHTGLHLMEGLFFGFSAFALLGALGAAMGGLNEAGEAEAMLKFVALFLPVAAAAVGSWIGLTDFDRRVDRYRDMGVLLTEARAALRHAHTEGVLRRQVQHLEHALLQENVEWYARMRHQRAG